MILAIGEAMVEFNQTRPGRPEYLQGFGGDTSNAIIAAARQGARAGYFTRVGDDAFGRLLLGLWKKEKVHHASVQVDPKAHTGLYFVRHTDKGHAFEYFRAGSAASRMRPADLPGLSTASFLHASGISLAISKSARRTVLAAFKRAKGRISLDPNLRLRLWPLKEARRAIEEAASLADYFFPSLEDAALLSNRTSVGAILDWAHSLGPRNVFLKLGAKGAMVSDGDKVLRIPAIKVKNVDATGAGDCFCGAALARLSLGDSVFEAARYANAAAALHTTGFGAVAPIPRPREILKLLRRSGG